MLKMKKAVSLQVFAEIDHGLEVFLYESVTP